MIMAAYNPYFPVAYQPPYSNYYPQQNQQPQMPTPQPTATTTSGIIWVSGAQEAQMYPVAPNNAVALWEQSGKTIYLKSADATGKPTMRVYDLIERAQNVSDASSGQGDKTIDYATKEELGKIVSVLEAFKGDLETMKGDLYGVAGRKKSTKKVEVEDDDA